MKLKSLLLRYYPPVFGEPNHMQVSKILLNSRNYVGI
ncbi:DAW1 isoform 4 [Pan troglodytes]|uniref:Dynein assembly factor with WD repeats 1 n=3 Tax=Hominidae TaxID=9604 RepID=F8WCV0_HUMAN|nr:DAW1 isoform 4 [Pan troglodytes]PNJ20312.1 DAW1 isoform 3 [Pongo abelii]